MKTERLILRTPRFGDRKALFALYNEPSIQSIYPKGKSRAEIRRLIADSHALRGERGYCRYVVELPGEGVIGDCGLVTRTMEGLDMVELLYHFLPAYRGKGFAAESCRAVLVEAFSGGTLHFVHAVVSVDNGPSKKLLEGLGFERINEIQFLDEHFFLYRLDADTFL